MESISWNGCRGRNFVTDNGWKLTVFNDAGDWDYLESAEDPRGNTLDYEDINDDEPIEGPDNHLLWGLRYYYDSDPEFPDESNDLDLGHIDKSVSPPDDPDVNIWCNPHSGVQSLSLEFVEQMRKQLKADLAAGKLRFPGPTTQTVYPLVCQAHNRRQRSAGLANPIQQKESTDGP